MKGVSDQSRMLLTIAVLANGRAVQVEPMKPVLTLAGTKYLKLNHDKLL